MYTFNNYQDLFKLKINKRSPKNKTGIAQLMTQNTQKSVVQDIMLTTAFSDAKILSIHRTKGHKKKLKKCIK